jgi:high-affinity nickel-transport protein
MAVWSRLSSTWNRHDRIEIGMLLGVIALMHLLGFATLILLIAPRHFQAGSQIFGIGLGATAYLFGLRHAFDADHIAAIDNTTRKLMTDGDDAGRVAARGGGGQSSPDGDDAGRVGVPQRSEGTARGGTSKPNSVGFWFAMGHSTIVLVMALLVIVGAHAVRTLLNDDSPTRHALGFAGTLASGLFLYLIAVMNIVALTGVWRAFTQLRRGSYSEEALEAALSGRGFLARLLRPIMNRIKRPVHIYPVGLLFGLGFDTATEVALLALAGTGAAAGLPGYAVLVLPLLFAAGMSLMDTLDGLLMTFAYDWAFMQPLRKIYYNLAITGLSIAVAVLIGSIELVSILHNDLQWQDPVTDWISGINLNNAGLAIVGLFAATWLTAIGYWKLANVESRWQPSIPPSDLTVHKELS